MTREVFIKIAIRESHQSQYRGVDYQKAAWEALQGSDFTPTDDEIIEVESSPFEGCECGFCETANWSADDL